MDTSSIAMTFPVLWDSKQMQTDRNGGTDSGETNEFLRFAGA